MGHYAHGDILIRLSVTGALGLAGCWRRGALDGPPLARALGRQGRRSPADPAALPVAWRSSVGAALIARGCVGGASYLRWVNVRADAFSLDHAREPDGLVAVIEANG